MPETNDIVEKKSESSASSASFSLEKLAPNYERIKKSVEQEKNFSHALICENVGGASGFMVNKVPNYLSKASKKFIKKKPVAEIVSYLIKKIESPGNETDKWVTESCYKLLNPEPEVHITIEPLKEQKSNNDEYQSKSTIYSSNNQNDSKYYYMNDGLIIESFTEEDSIDYEGNNLNQRSTDVYDVTNHKTFFQTNKGLVIEPISKSDQIDYQRKTLKRNLNNYGIAVDEATLKKLNPIEINNQLTKICSKLNAMSDAQKAHLDNLNKQERQLTYSLLSNELCTLGRQLDSKPLQVIGKVIELGVNIEKLAVSISSIANKTAQLGISACGGPITFGLAAINILLSLVLSNQPSAELQYLQHISKQIDALTEQMTQMRQEIQEGFLGLSKIQIQTFEILKSCLTHLHHDLNGVILGQHQALKSQLENLESTFEYLTRFQHIAFNNQYLQPLNHLCIETKNIELQQMNKAKLLMDGLKIWIREEIKNKLLNGSIIMEAESTIERKIELLSKCLSFDDNGDKQISGLIGYFLNQNDLYNPLILNYATSHYLLHVKRFYFLQKSKNDSFVDEIILEIKNQKKIISEASSHEISEQYIQDYYDALTEVKNAQDACINAINRNRFQYYNRDYIQQEFYRDSERNPALAPQAFNLTESITSLVDQFINHSIPHATNTTSQFCLTDDTNHPYPAQNIQLERLFIVLKQATQETRRNLSKLWCLDFLKQASLSITTPSHFNEPNKIADSSNGKIFRYVRDDYDVVAEPKDVNYKITINQHRHLEFTITSKLQHWEKNAILYHVIKNSRPDQLIDRTIESPIELKFTLKNGEKNHVHFKFHTYGVGLTVENAEKRENIQRELPKHIANKFADLNQHVDCVEIRTENFDSIQETLNQVWNTERLNILNKFDQLDSIVSDNNETHCFINYKKALKKLDYAASKLKMHAYLHGFKFPDNIEIVTSEIIQAEIRANVTTLANQTLILSPSLENTLSEDSPRITRNDFLVIENLPEFHPLSLLNDTQRSLIIFKFWFQQIRLTKQDLFNSFIHQTNSNLILNAISELRKENNQQNLTLLIQSLDKVRLKLDNQEELGILSSQEYHYCYKEIGSWILNDNKGLQILTGLIEHNKIDIDKLNRGWEINFNDLTHLTQQPLINF